MKIAVSASGDTLDAMVDPRFGRCPYYIFVDVENDSVEIKKNPSASAGGGAGVQAAQFVIEQEADHVISRNVGPNAFNVFAAADVPVYTVAGTTVRRAVEALKANELEAISGATGRAHAGMGSLGPARSPEPAPPASPNAELEALKREVAALRKSVASLLEKVDELTEGEE
jgi:predicted Fe-Mo cluster-binding NifX family protein